MTVYQEIQWCGIHGRKIKVYARSSITDWAGWPDDIRDVMRTWNRNRRLRFVPTPSGGYWTCPDCRRHCNSDGTTAALIDGALVCDDCMIGRARRFGILGRRETELEKAKRWQRNLQKKLLKYRHNAIQERIYVAALKDKLLIAEEMIKTHGLDDEYSAALRKPTR